MKHTTRTFLSLVLTVCTVILFSANLQAATLTVTNTSDTGSGSLRDAIAQTNATLDNDTINFSIPAASPNCAANGVCTIRLTSGELAVKAASIAGALTITNAAGANKLLISGNNKSRVFFVSSGANLTLDGVTITGGNGTGTTYALYDGDGGGIYNKSGTLILMNSTVSNNNTEFSGGGIYNYNWSRGTLTLINSTVSGNSAIFGGGIYNNYGIATLLNSTLSGNTGLSNGGGFYNDYSSVLNLISVTVTKNRSNNAICTDCAGGVFNYNRDASSTINLLNTIIAENTAASAAAAPDFSGKVSAASSNNIIGSNQLTDGISNGTNNNQIGSAVLPINPLLSPLGNYGGATETHSLLSGSPAIDRGNNCVLFAGGCGNGNPSLGSDQRGSGFSRQLGGSVDVGAVELSQSVAGYDMSGRISYGATPSTESPKFVSGVVMSASGASFLSANTDSAGFYLLRNLIAGGQYTVSPTKTGDANGITPFDATLVLRCVAAGSNCALTNNQRIAADTNNSNSITPFDATQILRFVAANGQTTAAGVVGSWKFTNSARNYGPLTSSISGENFDAVLIGEVNGNWTPSAPSFNGNEEVEPQEITEDNNQFKKWQQLGTPLQLALPANAMSASGSDVVIPVNLKNNGGKAISSFSFDVAFDPSVLQPQSSIIDTTDASSGTAGCLFITDTSNKGRIGIAATCPAIGIIALETQLNLLFTVVGTEGSTALTFSQTPMFEDNNGQLLPQVKTSGMFTIAAPDIDSVDVSQTGQGIKNAQVKLLDK